MMGEIADDHFVQLWWEEGTGIGADLGVGPYTDCPEYGGMNSYIERRMEVPANTYRCKYCGTLIGFIQRRPYNYNDGSLHTCLADARRKMNEQKGVKS